MFGIGYTVTVKTNEEPIQDPAVGVTEYVIVCTELVVLIKCWLIDVWATFWADCPVSELLSVKIVHVYSVFAGTILVPLAGVTCSKSSLQIAAAILAIDGFGATTTETVKLLPAHPLASGVTV